jgi:enoyl-CoA hydratase/carnithine racemase
MRKMNQVQAAEPIVPMEQRGRVAILTLPGADRYNPLSGDVIDALTARLVALASDRGVRVLVIRAEGRAFCAGHDLKELRSSEDTDFHRDLFARCARMMETIINLPQPVIAQVQGVATAAGCQLVATCDLAVASEKARFATSGINLGLFCATPAVALTRNVPLKAAAELLFTGDFIDAAEAKRLGLVNRVVAPEALEQATWALAEQIASKPAAALRAGKDLLRRQLEVGLAAAYRMASETMACNLSTAETREGIDAFLEKRTPKWD